MTADPHPVAPDPVARRRPVVGLLLACHPGPVVAVTASVTIYAVVVDRTTAGIAAVACAVGCGQLSTGWQNDALDAPVDLAVGRRDKPIANGLVVRATVGRAAILAAVGCVVASFCSGWRAGTVDVIAFGLATVYNLGLKRTAASVLPYLGAFGLLPCFVTLGAPGSPLPPWPVPVACALLGAAAHVLNVLPDAEGDRRSGTVGLPLRVGRTVAWGTSGALLVGSSALLAFGSRAPSAAGSAAFGGCVILGAVAVLAGARSSPWGFRLACVVALADVGLLAIARP